LFLALLLAQAAWPQDRMHTWYLSGPTQSSVSPRFEMDYVSPQLHKWYAPPHLLESYVQPWYAVDTRYSQEVYRRYVDKLLEGEEWTDSFGRPLGRGWLVYTWNQTQPQRNGSLIRKQAASATGTSAYSAFFQNLVIAADENRGNTFRLMVGDNIETRFTPLTFYKPAFNGVRLDYSSDRYLGSAILSRPSRPNQATLTNSTHLMGGHTVFQLGDLARLGLTYVNAHNAQTQRRFSFGSPLKGSLTTSQLRPLQKLWVRVRDDSPEDNAGGPAVYRYDIVLQDTSGRELRGSQIGFFPRVEGGRLQDGALVVEGTESLVLEYDLAALNYQGLQSPGLQAASIELALANDYRLEMASDLQTSGDRLDPEVIFLSARRAQGKVEDDSNSRLLRLEYGLPTASEILGLDWDLVNWHGLSTQGEVALNRRYRKYPGPREAHLRQAVDQAHAAYLQTAYQRYPWLLWGEAFSIAADYSTQYWLVQGSGEIKYKAPIPEVYEFVEDDDDHNAIPEWVRPFQATSNERAFPAYDENGDFIYDHNQNTNLFPDYEEPFLRFRADRPEFLFGLDLNHNNWIDRFENDELPDYPYKPDHRGYNVYVRGNAGPNFSGTLGYQRLKLMAGDGRARSLYTLWAWTRSLARGGRLRVYEFGEWVQDHIPDDVQQWVQPVGALGRMQDFRDPLPARNTWKNTLYLDADQRLGKGLRLFHRAKWELLSQRDPAALVRRREGRPFSGFLGVINKAEWTLPLGLGALEPRFKSEFRQDRPFSTRFPRATSLEEIALLLWTQPLMAERTRVNYFARYGRQLFSTELETGLELSRFWMLEGRREEIAQDYTSWALVLQVVNRTAYLGYKLVSRVGLQWRQRHFEDGDKQKNNLLFVNMTAGLN
jgi:hypothetical protein